MYHPWKPVERVFRCHPFLRYSIDYTTLELYLSEWYDQVCRFEMKLTFEDSLAGLKVFDESTYQGLKEKETEYLPREEEMRVDGFSPIPWPIWKSERNFRKEIYGQLGGHFYESVDTYYIVGAGTVLLADIADCEPTIEILKTEPVERVND